ncbi:ABC transporter substrate-binding protein [Paenibacillus apiarius]|uniref:ABC transporter substrate-binding protein n=1 Tax=Paenibacillus apiarius TaxID=46240 RepID=UPI003B3BDCF1
MENYDYYPPSWCIIDEMIEGAGGKYMQLSKDGYIELSMEAIIAANPEKIILTQFQEPDNEVIKDKLLANEKLKNVDAIKTGNVMVADYTNAIRGSLQLADLYEKVAAFIHPELFSGK